MSKRTEQVSELVQREVSQILTREIEPPKGTLITIMGAEVTPDLRYVKIFVSILPESKTGSALSVLKRNTREVQRLLNQRMTMKFSPHIVWEIDLTNVKYAAIDDALNK